MKKLWTGLGLTLLCIVFYSAVCAASPITQRQQELASQYGFTLEDTLSDDSGFTGERLSASEYEELFSLLMESLESLPDDFMRNAGVENVYLVKNLTCADGCELGSEGLTGGSWDNSVVFTKGIEAYTIYHEFFHVLDLHFTESDPKWVALNPRGFAYGRGPDTSNPAIRDSFVTEYAQYSDIEDRAETFGIMMVEGEDFMQYANASPYLKAKMEYIIDATVERGALTREFWENHLGY